MITTLAIYLLVIGIFILGALAYSWSNTGRLDRVFGIWVGLNHILPAIALLYS
jgi:hypothetical protein